MQKREFIKKLKGELQWYLSTAELRTILQEYEGYFATAAANGSGEVTAASELGDPALVAAEILSERYGTVGKKRMSARLLFAFAAFAFTCYTYIISPYIGTARFFFVNNFMWDASSVQLLFLTPTVLALLAYPHITATHTSPVTKLVLANIATLVFGTLGYLNVSQAMFLAITDIDRLAEYPIWGGLPMDQFGPLAANILLIIAAALAALTVAAVLKTAHGGQMAIPLIYLNCTGIYAAYQYMMILQQLDDPRSLAPALYHILNVVIIGLVVSAAIFMILLARVRRSKRE